MIGLERFYYFQVLTGVYLSPLCDKYYCIYAGLSFPTLKLELSSGQYTVIYHTTAGVVRVFRRAGGAYYWCLVAARLPSSFESNSCLSPSLLSLYTRSKFPCLFSVSLTAHFQGKLQIRETNNFQCHSGDG